mgnify:CR=1 FL=1
MIRMIKVAWLYKTNTDVLEPGLGTWKICKKEKSTVVYYTFDFKDEDDYHEKKHQLWIEYADGLKKLGYKSEAKNPLSTEYFSSKPFSEDDINQKEGTFRVVFSVNLYKPKKNYVYHRKWNLAFFHAAGRVNYGRKVRCFIYRRF